MDDDKVGLLSSLTPVRLTDKPTFDLAFSTLKQPISDYSFACTFMWAEPLRITWAQIARHVCIFANGAEDLTMLNPPIGLPGATEADFSRAVAECFDIMDAYNAPRNGCDRSRIEYVSDELLERFSAASPFPLSASPLWADYVYDTSRLITLEGGDLKSKRHARSKFLRDFPDARTEPLSERHVGLCLSLLESWARHGDDTHDGEVNDAHLGTDILRNKDQLATSAALRHHAELGLRGMVVLVGDRLAGFTLGQSLSPMQSMVLIEKTSPEFPGCPQLIFSEFCRTALAGSPECNAGDDWGIPTLRFTKQSYRPIRLLSKHVLARTSLPLAVPVPAVEMPSFVPEPFTRSRPAPEAGPMDLQIRQATPADLEALVAVEKDCFERPEERFTRRQIRALVQNPRATVIIAEADGKIAGWAVGLYRQHSRWQSGRIYAVGVHREFRGRGIGRKLTEHLLDGFRARAIERVYLEVREDNTAALTLYKALGFTPIRRLTAYYGPGVDGLSCRAMLKTSEAMLF
ncbi:MAG TPA: GNAT family N-acetyltransferase [Phycisphaerales bacterium]|nr:GNAT family N-acetyltransferase [Phycisphaerales bacterium]